MSDLNVSGWVRRYERRCAYLRAQATLTCECPVALRHARHGFVHLFAPETLPTDYVTQKAMQAFEYLQFLGLIEISQEFEEVRRGRAGIAFSIKPLDTAEADQAQGGGQ